MGGDRGDGGEAGAPDLPLENNKLSFISKKKNWYELPSRRNKVDFLATRYIRNGVNKATPDQIS